MCVSIFLDRCAIPVTKFGLFVGVLKNKTAEAILILARLYLSLADKRIGSNLTTL